MPPLGSGGRHLLAVIQGRSARELPTALAVLTAFALCHDRYPFLVEQTRVRRATVAFLARYLEYFLRVRCFAPGRLLPLVLVWPIALRLPIFSPYFMTFSYLTAFKPPPCFAASICASRSCASFSAVSIFTRSIISCCCWGGWVISSKASRVIAWRSNRAKAKSR